MKIVAICGSLRGKSFNQGALRFAIESAPEDIEIETLDISNLPLFNQDFEYNLPKEVAQFKEKVKSADAILFVTPEYNYSIPGVLKNAIDWGSRPRENNSWEAKPAAIMGVSSGFRGTVRAQMHLRQIFVTINILTFNKPELLMSSAGKFEGNGDVTDQETKEHIKGLVQALVDFTNKQKSS